MSTIYEVARLAGVSPATVSRVFNGIRVNPGNVTRVRQAAEELQFVPNRTARRLRRQSSEVICLIIPDIENPFFTALARGVEDHAHENGFSAVFCDSDDQPDKEERYLRIAQGEQMAGVILVPTTDHPPLEPLLKLGTPVVAVDRSAGTSAVDAVVLDNFDIALAATESMYARGFRRVGCITGPSDTETAQHRAAGWRQAFSRHHKKADPNRFLRHADYRVAGGRDAMESLLMSANPPDAVVVANNSMTIGALEALQDHAVSPTELGLACLGDLPYSVLQRSGVQAYPLPARALGRAAADLLLKRIAGDTSPACRLVVRD
jgi:LacI family transcriptional regulator